MDLGKSILVKVGVKLAHPETYSGGSDLEEFKTFVTGILEWLKMNCLLGATSIRMQVDYVRTCLTGKALEKFLWNVEQFDHSVHNWNLEMVMQGLQKRFLHTLMYHHVSHKFNTVAQGLKTIQELMNDLTKHPTWIIQLQMTTHSNSSSYWHYEKCCGMRS